jgi:ferredoxin-NADP reductase
MLRTLDRDGDRRRVVLLHAAGTADELPFGSEIDALRSRLDLDVVRVVESASPEWREMVGRLDGRMLASLLPDPDPRANYLICGPDVMMDAVERYLREAGVPAGRIDAERFNIA